MDADKKWWASKSVWGGTVAIIAGIAGVFGYAVDTGDQETIVAAITGIAGSIGGLVAVYGRIKAKDQIK